MTFDRRKPTFEIPLWPGNFENFEAIPIFWINSRAERSTIEVAALTTRGAAYALIHYFSQFVPPAHTTN